MPVQIYIYACIKLGTCICLSNTGVFMHTKGVYVCIHIYVPASIFFFLSEPIDCNL